jgi:hypothetical protein
MPNSRPEEEFHVWKLWIYLEAFLLAIKIPAYSRAAAYQTQALHTHSHRVHIFLEMKRG